jgi:hypothetical protein
MLPRVSGKGLDLDELLAAPLPDPELRNVALGIFAYAKVLLEEEDNLTRVGNLNGVAKDKLRARTLELLGVAEPELDSAPREPDSDSEPESGEGSP